MSMADLEQQEQARQDRLEQVKWSQTFREDQADAQQSNADRAFGLEYAKFGPIAQSLKAAEEMANQRTDFDSEIEKLLKAGDIEGALELNSRIEKSKNQWRIDKDAGKPEKTGGTNKPSATVTPSGKPVKPLQDIGAIAGQAFLDGRVNEQGGTYPSPPITPATIDSLTDIAMRPLVTHGGYGGGPTLDSLGGATPPPPANDGSYTAAEYEAFKKRWVAERLWER
jgi:hypothetical protein